MRGRKKKKKNIDLNSILLQVAKLKLIFAAEIAADLPSFGAPLNRNKTNCSDESQEKIV